MQAWLMGINPELGKRRANGESILSAVSPNIY
jgi:hypothetical protein